MFYTMMVAAIAVMRLFPETPTARFLHRWLAEKPAAWIDAVRRKHLIFLLLTIGTVLVLREAAPMLAGSSELALFGIWDASVYLDVAMAAWTIAALARGRSGWAVLRPKLVTLLGRPRITRARRRARRSPPRARLPANDDEGLTLAA
ncbi:MAG: hypothetical protein V4475_08275 [Pseudomonadota bacterium]